MPSPALSPRLALVPGSRLRHLGADPDLQYVTSRDIAAQEKAGVVDGPTAAFARSIDGAAGHVADGRLQLDEIEAAAKAATFEPAQARRLLPLLAWSEVEAPTPAPSASSSLADLPPLVAEDVSVAPSLPEHTPVPFRELPRSHFAEARKVAAFDPAAAKVGVTVAALRAAGRVSMVPRIGVDLTLAKAVFRRLIEQQPVTMSARARVPMPGRHVLPLFATGAQHEGSVALRLVVETTLQERVTGRRRVTATFAPSMPEDRAATLTAKRSSMIEVEVPAEHRTILVHLPSGDEHPLEAGVHAPKLPAGAYRVELYDAAGARIEVSAVEVPSSSHGKVQEADLSAFLGFRLFGEDGVPLHRNLVHTDVRRLPLHPSQQHAVEEREATYAWSADARAPAGSVALARDLEPVKLGVPPGRYVAWLRRHDDGRSHGDGLKRLVVDVFPEGVAKIERDGQVSTLVARNSRATLDAVEPSKIGGLQVSSRRACVFGRFARFGVVEAALNPDLRIAT
jgi:hypothetical protein